MKRLLSLIVLPIILFAEQPRLLMIGGGIFDVNRKHPKGQYQIEYRSNYDIFENDYLFIRPLAALMGTFDGSLYFCSGIAFDFFLGKHFNITPSFAPGLYYQGGGKNLGFPLEFRSTIEMSYRFKNQMRIGAQYYHISNGSVGWKNPGTESLVFFIGFTL